MPRALVTGGAGFIGSHVADLYLENGYDVTILDNFATGRRENVPDRARLAELDLTSADAASLVRDGKFDVISHLGAQIDVRKSVANPMFDATINVGLSPNCSAVIRCRLPNSAFDDVSLPVSATPNQPKSGAKNASAVW